MNKGHSIKRQHYLPSLIFILSSVLLIFGCKQKEEGRLIIEMPCLNDSGQTCKTIDSMSRSLVLSGDQYESFDIKVRIRGVIELRDYPQGESKSGFWQVGGKEGSFTNTSNIYKITTATPEKVYYINAGKSNSKRTFKIDTTLIIKSNGGTILTLTGLSVNGLQNHNQDQNGNPLDIPSVQRKEHPFDGQFVQVDVLSQKRN